MGNVDMKTGSPVAEYEHGPFGETIQATGPMADVFTFRFSTKFTDAETGLLYYGFRYYDSEKGRWLSRDLLGDEAFFNDYTRGRSQELVDYLRAESRKPAYIFLDNDGVNKSDFLGLAYFAYRTLDSRAGKFLGVVPLMGVGDDFLNTMVAHEQLFFEDAKSLSDMGFFSDNQVRPDKSTLKYSSTHDGGWNDCVMRQAVANVNPSTYCLLGKVGKTDKYNCQDWAEAVRREYRRLVKDPNIAKKCCPTSSQVKK
jgi:RHS repeat-associated protein